MDHCPDGAQKVRKPSLNGRVVMSSPHCGNGDAQAWGGAAKERRQVTVMFSGLVGSTALSALSFGVSAMAVPSPHATEPRTRSKCSL
jgi:hypothetical protein